MRRQLAAALTAAVLAAPLVAAASGPAGAPSVLATLNVSIPGSFAGCDPGSPSTTAATDDVLSLVLPSAFTPGPLDVPVGDTTIVAQAEVVSASPQTVAYTIATGSTWPNGTPLTAADLSRTWRERRSDRVVADLGYRDVATVRATATGNGATVTFRHPYADWESLFNLMVPAATSGSRCALPSAAFDPSVGPYELASASTHEVVLRANPSWTGTPPAYTSVDVTTDPAAPPAPGDDPRVTYLPSPTLAELQAITSSGGYASRVQHDSTVVSLDFASHGPAALAPAVRGALARFVDRASLVARLAAPIDDTAAPAVSHLFGQGQVQYLGPSGVPVSATQPPALPAPGATGAAAYGTGSDPAAAAAALLAHGYVKRGTSWRTRSGAPLAICVEVPADDPSLGAAAVIVVGQLRAQGVGVVVVVRPGVDAVVRDLRRGACTSGIVSRTGDGFVTHSAADWLAPSAPVPVGLTWTGVDDPVVAADAAIATGVLNPDLAAPTWDAMDARLWALMVGLPLYSPSVFVGWSPSIAGVLESDTLAGFVAQVPTLVPSSTK